MISRHTLVMAWDTGRLVELHVPVLSIPMESTNAEATKGALDQSIQLKLENRYFNDIIASAKVGGKLDGQDGAYSNRKYIAHLRGLPNSSSSLRCKIEAIWWAIMQIG